MRHLSLIGLWSGLLLLLLGSNGSVLADDPKLAAVADAAASGPLEGFSDWVTSADWSADGKVIATGTSEKVVLWDASTLKKSRELTAKIGRVRAVVFTADGKHVIGGGYQKIVVWNAQTGEQVRELKGHRGFVTSLSLHPNGKSFASSSEDSTVRLWDVTTGESKGSLPKPKTRSPASRFPPMENCWRRRRETRLAARDRAPSSCGTQPGRRPGGR